MLLVLGLWHVLIFLIFTLAAVIAFPHVSEKEPTVAPVFNIAAFQPSKVWNNLKARVAPEAIAAASAGVSSAPEQPQNLSSTSGTNGSSDQPGVFTNSDYESPYVNCSDLRSGRDNKCWDQLNLTEYVKDWTRKNQCRQNEPFASCFLRWEGFPGLDCTGIKVGSCSPPPFSPGLDPKTFYVAYNIYAINQFFWSWFTAVGDAAAIAGQNVDSIVQIIDPVSKTNLILDDILIALTGIFAIAPGLGLGVVALKPAESAVAAGTKAVSDTAKYRDNAFKVAQTVENALVAFPQIGRYLFPVETEASQIVQMSELKSQLVDIVAMVQSNLNKTLVTVMANVTGFLAFASQGNFTASAPSLPDQENYLLYAFNTYVISAGLSGNNIYATVGKDTNVQQLATNSSSKHGGIDLSACKEYDEYGTCDCFWYSNTFNSTFGLDNFSHMNRNYGDTMRKLFENFTTPELLFDNAYACYSNGNYGSPINVTVNAAGVNTQCLSQLQIVTWDMACANPSTRGCEFLEIPRQNTFFGNCGSHSIYSVMDSPKYCVPYSYLGPLINQNQYELQRT